MTQPDQTFCDIFETWLFWAYQKNNIILPYMKFLFNENKIILGCTYPREVSDEADLRGGRERSQFLEKIITYVYIILKEKDLSVYFVIC